MWHPKLKVLLPVDAPVVANLGEAEHLARLVAKVPLDRGFPTLPAAFQIIPAACRAAFDSRELSERMFMGSFAFVMDKWDNYQEEAKKIQ